MYYKIMYKFLPFMTNDYSVGLYEDNVDDIYHSAFGALSEAYEKFILPLPFNYINNNKKELRVLDLCYGIGYNTKAFLNEFIKITPDIDLIIDCVDTNRELIELSPFISSYISWFERCFNRNSLYKNIKSYKEANKIIKLNTKRKTKYKIDKLVNLILIKNLIAAFGKNFLSEGCQKILSNHEFMIFFNKDCFNLIKNIANIDDKLYLNNNLSCYLHNIYYRNISKRFIFDNKITSNTYIMDKIHINFYDTDVRNYIKNTSNIYDIVFLDGFTPAKCPCIWSLDFFNELYTHLVDDGIIVTYNTSAPVRKAMKLAGFYIGNTLDINNKYIGTIASKNKDLIVNPLTEVQEGLLNTKAGIPYRDDDLSHDNDTILLNRRAEVDASDLITSSKYYSSLKHNSSSEDNL